MNPGAGTRAGHIFSSPGPGLPELKFFGWEPGRLNHIAQDLENPGYPGCRSQHYNLQEKGNVKDLLETVQRLSGLKKAWWQTCKVLPPQD